MARLRKPRITSKSINEDIELFEGGWLQLGEDFPQVRIIVARHRVPPAGKSVTGGKRIDEWVYLPSLSESLSVSRCATRGSGNSKSSPGNRIKEHAARRAPSVESREHGLDRRTGTRRPPGGGSSVVEDCKVQLV
jgi:hypothetical protein